MPTASEELQTQFADDGAAWKVLRERFEDDRGTIRPTHEPRPTLSREESDAIDYLFYEWDYCYDPWPKEPK